MNTLLHKASSRGYFNHGWLKTHHTFSFGDYYDPVRINFGALRVLNDDKIAPGMGFDMHPHREMEIVSIPLGGALEHRDSLGHSSVIRSGEIQAMSAGTGIYHSEYNESKTDPVELLQIWVFPDRPHVEPRYQHATIAELIRPNELSVVVSPYPGNGKGLWIYQQAWFLIGDLSEGVSAEYAFRSSDSFGVYAFVIDGKVEVAGTVLGPRDGMGISESQMFGIRALEDARILLIEVPSVG